jgi:hypothetical protein
MDSPFAAGCGTTSSDDCGSTSAAGSRITSDPAGDTGGDCGTDSGKDCAGTKHHLTGNDYTYTDFALGSQPSAAGPSNSLGPTAQSDTRTPEIQVQEEHSEARAQQKKERKEKARRVFNNVRLVAENIIKGKF